MELVSVFKNSVSHSRKRRISEPLSAMTNATKKPKFSKEDALNFTLRCLCIGIGRYPLNEVELPALYKQKGSLEKPEGVKVVFFEDVNLLLETTKRVRDTEWEALPSMLETLGTLEFLELGVPTFKQEHLLLLSALRSITSLQEWVADPIAWRRWLISLVQKMSIDDLSNEELRDIASWPICFASESFFLVFDGDRSSIEVAPFVRFVLRAIQHGVYPWTFDSK